MKARFATLFLLTGLLLVAACRTSSNGTGSDTGPAVADTANTVVLISLDGFRWDQLDIPEAENLSQLWQRGVRAEGLIPSYPSKTFPNHYTIVTGLYPAHHGIVSNNMRDPELGEFHLSDRDAVEDTRWWGGEPIWVTAERAGLPTAAMFWPGTEAEIAGVRPRQWFPFDGDKPFSERTAKVLEWLAMPAGERPRFITLYFQQPDGANHRHGPRSAQAYEAIAGVDAQIGGLIAGIERLGLADQVDLVVTSDHGMAEINKERVIPIEQLVEFEKGELFESGAFMQVFPNPGREQLLLEALQGAHPELQVFAREEAPEHLKIRDAERLAPIIGLPSVGWEVVSKLRLLRLEGLPDGYVGGHHGPDPADQRMHGIFVAAGPSFEQGLRIDRFENIHIYELLCDLLGLEAAPNDGDPGVLRDILAN